MPKVLLTGANGFIAVYILKALLERDYEVVGTVRAESKIPYLETKFSEYSAKLAFAVVPDITDEHAFDEVIEKGGFDAVIHTSSPFFLTPKNVVKEIYEPAVNGTLAVLKGAKAHGPSIKQVIVLSSYAALIDGTDRPGYVYTEKDWNPATWEAGLAMPQISYFVSKKLAEKAAWDFMDMEKPDFALTTLLPPMVFGPPIQEVNNMVNLNESCAEIYGYYHGLRKPGNYIWLWIDVRDAAEAHVKALECPEAANQRYLISNGRYSAQQFVDLIWKRFPKHAKAKNVPRPGSLYPATGVYSDDTSKAAADFEFACQYTFEHMFTDTIERFQELEREREAA